MRRAVVGYNVCKPILKPCSDELSPNYVHTSLCASIMSIDDNVCVCVCERTVLCSDFNVIIKRRRIIIHAPSGSTYVYTHQSSAVNPAFSNNFVHGILSVFEYIININGFFPRPPRHFNQSPIIKLIDSHSIELKTNPKDI